MDAVSATALGPATLSALSALRPVQPLAVPPPQDEATSGLSFQNVAQSLLERSVQTALTDSSAEATSGLSGLLGNTGTSLLASLTAPQPPAEATPAQLTPAQATTQSTPATPSTPSIPIPTTPTQEAFAGSATLDFALQTALRFGAGVGGLTPAAAPNPVLDAGLVRDAAAVPRLEGLQAREGGPGAESYRQLPAAPQAMRAYGPAAPAPATPGAGRLDLMA